MMKSMAPPGGTKLHWNMFRDKPRQDEVGSAAESKFFKTAEKGLLVFAYFITFCAVLTGKLIHTVACNIVRAIARPLLHLAGG